MKAGAFTLVELLVVLVIILALIAIVLPVVNIARARSLASGCGAGLSQIGKAVLMYSDDHEGWLPCHSVQSAMAWDPHRQTDNRVIGRPKEWRESLKPYTRSYEVFWCPADRHRGTDFLADLDEPDDHRQLYTSYQMALNLYSPSYWGPDGSLAVRLSQLKHGASNTCYIGDWSVLPVDADVGVTPHGHGGNGLFLDGSVRWYAKMVTVAKRNHPL
ncbi:MAG: hypothetical protein HRF45_01660 [Fimbriimonadia bacterium]|jgi:prepilin-type processing-associated H-X9-DG protein